MPDFRRSEIISMRNQGVTFERIGEYFNLSRQRISQIYYDNKPKPKRSNIIKIMWNGKEKRLLRK